MQETSSRGSHANADSFYFMFFATSIFLKDSKDLQMSPDPHPKLKFSIYKGNNESILGPQIFNSTRDVIKPNLTSGWSKLEKVQMCFFLKNFQRDRQVEFMGLLYDIGSGQQQFLGDIVLSTHKYVEAFHEGAQLVHEQGQFGPYVVNYVVLIEKDRHRLEKLFKKYKESKEYLELKEVTEINMGSLAEAANSQHIIESTKGIENNDFRLGVDQDENHEDFHVGETPSAQKQTQIISQQPEAEKIENQNNENTSSKNENEQQRKIVEPQRSNKIEHEKSEEIVQETQNKQDLTQIKSDFQSKKDSYEPVKESQKEQRTLPNLEPRDKQKITKKEEQVSKSRNIDKTDHKPNKTTKTQSVPKISPPINKQLKPEKEIKQTESVQTNQSFQVSQHEEPTHFKITLKVLIFVLLFGILIFHFMNPIETNEKTKKLARQDKSSQKDEKIGIKSKKNQKVKPKKKSK